MEAHQKFSVRRRVIGQNQSTGWTDLNQHYFKGQEKKMPILNP